MGTTSELRSTTSWLRVGGPQPPVDVGREAGVVLARDDLDPLDRRKRRKVLGAARVVGHEDRRLPVGRLTNLPHERSDQLRVLVTRDNDCHGRPVALVPAPGGSASLPGPGPRRSTRSSGVRRSGKIRLLNSTEGDPSVLVGEIDPSRQLGEPPPPRPVQRRARHGQPRNFRRRRRSGSISGLINHSILRPYMSIRSSWSASFRAAAAAQR